MPKVKPLTPAQAKKQAHANRTKALARGLRVYKDEKDLTMEEMAAQLKIGKNKLPRVLKESDEALPLSTVWIMLDMAGLEIRPKQLKLDA